MLMSNITEEDFQKELIKLREEMWKDIDLIIENTERKVNRLKEMLDGNI
jgi:hypothetical protein